MPGLNLNGILPVRSLSDMLETERREAEVRQHQPYIQSLASHVQRCWELARTAKQQTVEPRLLRNLRQRRGEYEPDMLADIKASGGAEIYMMITSTKCRAASAWLRDTLMGVKDEKPWTIDPTPIPDLPPNLREAVFQEANQKAMQIEAMQGVALSQQEAYELVQQVKSRMMVEMKEMAREAAERMELKMEDQLTEGGFREAFANFIDDLVTFPAAIIKGPIIRKKPRLVWKESVVGQFDPVVIDQLVETWERCDPFNLYPAPNSTHPNDGFLIERHRLSRQSLSELIGVDGYDDGAIKAVLDAHGQGGLRDWLAIDTAKAQAEGKSVSSVMSNPEAEIDALQLWGAVQGKMLIEWGMNKDEQEIDPVKEYHCEVWKIGSWVIKAILNYDPFHRKPYFKASFEEIPGSFWGNAPPDLMRDNQSMCNYAARAIADNMGIASGPQVGFNIDRLPAGEDLTQMYPWKTWQFTSDPMGSTAPAIDFFQPQSIAGELMAIFDKFSARADEDTGIPRYITGENAGIGGAGRTASGMSMLMGNAGKTIKQVIFNIDTHVMQPLIERLYFHNMMNSDDPDLKGDVNIAARGANSLVVKDAAQVRRNEFLQTALNSPIAQQIVGMEGIAALLHQQAKTLDMDADEIVPSGEAMKLKMLMNPPMMGQPGQPGQPQAAQGNQQTLMTGEPVTDTMGAPAR
ncbi:MAG: hypothetical protein A2Y38_14670 [Spirochaetes bacterium GWB1_59_5]|nr:MAG: hypothetical protein A2Y38_14670 [Spirochaetes bacterium GWB1_59_5]